MSKFYNSPDGLLVKVTIEGWDMEGKRGVSYCEKVIGDAMKAAGFTPKKEART